MEIAGRKLTPAIVVGAGMFAAALIGFCGINPHLPGGGDNAGYIAEAEAWLTLGRRGNLHEPGAPYDGLKPPLFSLLLAGVEFLFGRSVVAMKAMLVLFSAGSVWAAWWALRGGLQNGVEKNAEATENNSLAAAAIAFWFALMPSLGLYTHDVLSDVPFTFFVLLAIGFAARGGTTKAGLANAAGLGLSLVLATEMRTAGVIVSAACGCGLAVEAVARRKQEHWRRAAAHAAIAAVIALAFLAWQAVQRRSYAGYLGGASSLYGAEALVDRVLRVGQYYGLFVPAETSGYAGLSPKGAVYALAFLAWIAAFTGMTALWRRGARALPLIWLANHAALLAWPFVDARFYLPTLPLFLAFAWVGARQAATLLASAPRIQAALFCCAAVFPLTTIFGTAFFFGSEQIESATVVEWGAAFSVAAGLFGWALSNCVGTTNGMQVFRRTVAAVFLGTALLRSVSENVVRERRRGAEPPGAGWAELHRASLWLKQNAGADEIVVSAKPSLVWFWSGLRGAPIPRTGKVAEAREQIGAARWIILDGIAENRAADLYLKPLLQAEPDTWEMAWSQQNTAVLRRKK